MAAKVDLGQFNGKLIKGDADCSLADQDFIGKCFACI